MPNIEVRGKYRTFRYDGDAPLDFTPYNNSIFLIRRPNPTTFVTLQQYVPGQGGAFTTFDPGSSYTMVTNADGSQDFNFNMGPYTRVDRLPSSTLIKTPNFYIGLDKNSIAVPISSYALSVNSPLSSVVNILYQNGQGNRLQYVAADSFKTGAPLNFTHFLPNSGYELRNRVPYIFFAPLKSEMGDAFALGNNDAGEYGMGYRYSQTRYFNDVGGTPFVLSADQTFGIWDKIVCNASRDSFTWNGRTIRSTSLAALSSHGASKALFVLGSNLYGKLGTGSSQQYYPTWTRVSGEWKDVEIGAEHMVAINSSGHLYGCGRNNNGQLGLGSGVASVNTLTLVDDSRNYVQVVTTRYSTSIRDTNGAVYSCGDNFSGQLGIDSATTPVYTLTREATNSAWTLIKTIKGGRNTLIALKNNQLYGCGTAGSVIGSSQFNLRILTRESLSLTDITDFYTTGFGTFIRRQGQDYLFAAGEMSRNSDNNLLATVSGGTADYFTKTTIPSGMRNIISNYSISKASSTGSDPTRSDESRFNIGYIGSDFFVYTKQFNSNVFQQKAFKAFDAFSTSMYPLGLTISESPIFLLSAASHFRPTPTPSPTTPATPTPTPTITLTPSPVPFTPFDVSEIGLVGSDDIDTNVGPNYVGTLLIYNYPKINSSAFAYQSLAPAIQPLEARKALNSTFDYEKTSDYNNVVVYGTIYNTDLIPPGRKQVAPRFMYKRIGSTWTYETLGPEFDAKSVAVGRTWLGTGQFGYDRLIITPPTGSKTQGIYNYCYTRDGDLYESVSYDRGTSWSTYLVTDYDQSSLGTEGPFNFLGKGAEGVCKPIYARTRKQNGTYGDYTVGLVGVNGNANSQAGTLFYSKRYPNLSYPPEIVWRFTIDNRGSKNNIEYDPIGFDFNYDYFNTPTIVTHSRAGRYSAPFVETGIISIHRYINNAWVRNTVKTILVQNNLTGVQYGDAYGGGSMVNNRTGSPTISMAFDSTNPNLIYIAHMRKTLISASGNSFKTPGFIDVICYNMSTNTVIFDESVICGSGDTGSLRTAPYPDLDCPNLYYNSNENKLYLFFSSFYFGGLGLQAGPFHGYTTRTGANNWSALNSIFAAENMFNYSRELKIKY